MKNDAYAAIRIDTIETTNYSNLIVIIVQMPFSPRTQLVDNILMADTAERIILMSRRRKQQLCCELILKINDHSLLISDENGYFFSLIGITTMQIRYGDRHIKPYYVEMKKQPRRVNPKTVFFHIQAESLALIHLCLYGKSICN